MATVDVKSDTISAFTSAGWIAENTGADGVARFDSLLAGPYMLRVRRIGFDPFHRVVAIRPGRTDTLIIGLHAHPMCVRADRATVD